MTMINYWNVGIHAKYKTEEKQRLLCLVLVTATLKQGGDRGLKSRLMTLKYKQVKPYNKNQFGVYNQVLPYRKNSYRQL